jgi:hypothetical protein
MQTIFLLEIFIGVRQNLRKGGQLREMPEKKKVGRLSGDLPTFI